VAFTVVGELPARVIDFANVVLYLDAPFSNFVSHALHASGVTRRS
jgi:hypothetical protein